MKAPALCLLCVLPSLAFAEPQIPTHCRTPQLVGDVLANVPALVHAPAGSITKVKVVRDLIAAAGQIECPVLISWQNGYMGNPKWRQFGTFREWIGPQGQVLVSFSSGGPVPLSVHPR